MRGSVPLAPHCSALILLSSFEGYEPLKREPLFARAETTAFWELALVCFVFKEKS